MAEKATIPTKPRASLRVTCSRDRRVNFPPGQKKGDSVANPMADGKYRCVLCAAEFEKGTDSHPGRK